MLLGAHQANFASIEAIAERQGLKCRHGLGGHERVLIPQCRQMIIRPRIRATEAATGSWTFWTGNDCDCTMCSRSKPSCLLAGMVRVGAFEWAADHVHASCPATFWDHNAPRALPSP